MDFGFSGSRSRAATAAVVQPRATTPLGPVAAARVSPVARALPSARVSPAVVRPQGAFGRAAAGLALARLALLLPAGLAAPAAPQREALAAPHPEAPAAPESAAAAAR